MIPTVLSIAGSDPCGGAGIQADLKTMTMIGVHAAAAVSCITVQNSHGVTEIVPLEGRLIRAQIEAVLADQYVTHVKIGMVGGAEAARAMGAALEGFGGEIVLDPVMAASAGDAPLHGGALEALRAAMVDRATVLTPNLPELALLAGLPIATEEELAVAAGRLLADHPRLRVVIAKGGHGADQGRIIDSLVTRGGRVSRGHDRIATRNTHGTGCTFASAFTAFHCRVGDDRRAFALAVDFMDQLLRAGAGAEIVRNRGGAGPLLHALAGSLRSGLCRPRP